MTVRWTLTIAIVIGLSACDSDRGKETEGAATPGESIAVSPGNPVQLSDRVEGSVEWRADAGLVVGADSQTWYLPPLDDGAYSVTAVEGGETVYRLDVEINGVKPDELTEASFDGGSGVAGKYGGTTFSARKTSDGFGEARYSSESGEIVSQVTAYDQGTVSWKGQDFTGKGVLSEAQEAALNDLAESELAPALTFTSLELACRPGAENVDPVVGAALLLPWQIILKYRTAFPATVARHYAQMTGCRYFADVTSPADTTGPSLAPSPGVMSLNNESPLPAALFYFPLDEEGATRSVSMAISH